MVMPSGTREAASAADIILLEPICLSEAMPRRDPERRVVSLARHCHAVKAMSSRQAKFKSPRRGGGEGFGLQTVERLEQDLQPELDLPRELLRG